MKNRIKEDNEMVYAVYPSPDGKEFLVNTNINGYIYCDIKNGVIINHSSWRENWFANKKKKFGYRDFDENGDDERLANAYGKQMLHIILSEIGMKENRIKEDDMGFYIYFDDENGQRWIYCDNKKPQIVNSKDFYHLNDMTIQCVHIFKTEKLAQKFIDVDCKYFADKDKIVIAENDGKWYESKKSARKSIKEKNVERQLDIIANDLEYHDESLVSGTLSLYDFENDKKERFFIPNSSFKLLCKMKTRISDECVIHGVMITESGEELPIDFVCTLPWEENVTVKKGETFGGSLYSYMLSVQNVYVSTNF